MFRINTDVLIFFFPLLNTQQLGLIVFFLFFGCAMVAVGSKAEILKNAFEATFSVTLVLVNLVMWYSPLGICSLIATQILIRGVSVFVTLGM